MHYGELKNREFKFRGKNFWKEIKINQKWNLGKMFSMYMHCFFKFLAHVNPRSNSPTFKTENTKTLT